MIFTSAKVLTHIQRNVQCRNLLQSSLIHKADLEEKVKIYCTAYSMNVKTTQFYLQPVIHSKPLFKLHLPVQNSVEWSYNKHTPHVDILVCHEGVDESNDLKKTCLFQTYKESIKCVSENVTLQSEKTCSNLHLKGTWHLKFFS